MATYQVDKLSCKREIVSMIIHGKQLRQMAEVVALHGEQCTKSSIERYMNDKFIEGCIHEDGSIEVREKEGFRIRVLK